MRKIAFFILFCGISVFAWGQSDQHITLGVKEINGKVNIKWIPSDYDIMVRGFEQGYNVYRQPIATLSGQLPETTSRSLRKKIVSNVTLPSRNTLNGMQSDAAQLAKLIAYDSTSVFTVALGSNTSDFKENIRKISELNNKKSSAHGFLMMAIDQDFEVAKNIGFGYIDVTASRDTAYLYQVTCRLDTTYYYFSNVDFYDPFTTSELLTLKGLTGESADSVAILKWPNDYTEIAYFNVERSTDNISFSRVNPEPYVSFSDENLKVETDIYVDSLPNNTDIFYYRIQPVGYFGELGEYSDTVEVKGTPSLYPIALSVDSIKELANGDAMLAWNLQISEDFNRRGSDIVDRYDIVVQHELDGDYILIDGPISYTENAQSHTFTPDGPHGYYSLRMTDDRGVLYYSIPHLLQLKDSIPPAPPTGLEGIMDNRNMITLDWEPNTEEDLDGYLVFISQSPDGEFLLVNNGPVADNHLEFYHPQDVHIDYLYVGIKAKDYRWNTSDMSQIIQIKKPDLNPPSKPLITFGNGAPEGIRLGLRLSDDADISHYILSRKQHKSHIWDELLMFKSEEQLQKYDPIQGEQHLCNYIDTTYQEELVTYNYRLSAVDKAGNVSHSKVRLVKPYDDGIRGVIYEASAYGVKCDDPYSTKTNALSAMPCTLLRWKYQTAYPQTLIKFSIYRLDSGMASNYPSTIDQSNPPPFVLIKTLSPSGPSDAALGAGFSPDEYVFIDSNGTKPGIHNIKYKILAQHSDGGTSEWSAEVVVQ